MKPMLRGAGGGGGKGGGGSSHVPTEAPNTLRSRAYARVIDVISEGEIEGLVDGLKSIYLDDTPIQADDGSMNFSGVTVAWRNGLPTQSYVPGFAAVENEIAVATEVKNVAPVVRAISNKNLSAVRVTVSVPQLFYQSTGDLSGTSVEIAIDINNNGGGWQEVKRDTISGKTMSRYQRSYRIDLPAPGPWQVRVRRISGDSTQANLQNKTFWDSYTEIIDAKLRYPNSALVAIQIDAAQFNRIPRRGYDIRGLRVRVPVNYDPQTRTYSGVWNGQFKIAWTDNPAWCFYDLLTNERYGLGQYLDEGQIDKWALYEIARYCDERVPDGFGGMEPRFTCNLYLQTRQEAFTVIQQMASVFRGMAWWANGTLTCAQDAPSDPVALFTAANVIDGMFTYSGSSAKQRHTVALVTWNDPADMYRQKVEYVEDEDGIQRFGVRETEIVAMGCTSRGQAHRVGRWLLYTERMETETVTFRAGLDAALVWPGAVIAVQDAARAGVRFGGRVMAATTTTVTLDAPVTIEAGKSYTLSVMLPDGTVGSRAVSNAPGSTTVLTLAAALPDVPVVGAVWVLAASDLAPTLWRVVALREVDGHQVEVTALVHEPGKYAAIERDIVLEQTPTSVYVRSIEPPTNLRLEVARYESAPGVMGWRGTLSWQAPREAARYRVMYRREADQSYIVETDQTSIDIAPMNTGAWLFEVRAISADGRVSRAASLSQAVTGETLAPEQAAVSISAKGVLFGIAVTVSTAAQTWLQSDRIFIYRATSASGRDTALKIGEITTPYGQIIDAPMRAGDAYWYWARVAHADGSFGPWSDAVYAQTLTDPEIILEQVQHAISSEHLASALAEKIEWIDTSGSVSGAITNANAKASQVLNQAIAQTETSLSARLHAERESLAAQLLTAALDADRTRATMRDAGIVVDPASGKVSISALDITRERVSQVSVDLDAVKSDLTLKASTSYVDNAIARAVISPEQIPAFDGVIARLASAEVRLDGHDAEIASKASLATVNAQEARLSVAESTLSALSGEIAQRVTQTQWQQHETRIGSAEQTLATLGDAAQIRQSVIAARLAELDSEDAARSLLFNILNADSDASALKSQLAAVTREARADVISLHEAMASDRQAVLARLGSAESAIVTEQTARASADQALASSLSQVQARLGSAESAIVTEQKARASADQSLASSISQVQARLDTGDFAAVKTQSSVTASKVSGLESRWSVKTQTAQNGKTVVGGLELIANGQTSEFGILADKLILYRPDGGGPKQVFAVGRVNGTNTLVLDGAVIADQVISARMIGDAQLGTLKLAGNAVTVPVTASRYDRIWGAQGTIIDLWVYLPFAATLLAFYNGGQGFPYGDRTWNVVMYIDDEGVMSAGGMKTLDTVAMSASRWREAGWHRVRVDASNDGAVSVNGRTLTALAAMR